MIYIFIFILLIIVFVLFYRRKKGPKVVYDIITKGEQEYILNTASFSESTVVSGNSGGIRHSETAWIHPNDPVVGALIQRIADSENLRFDQAESLQVVRYKPGGFYKAHYDECCDDIPECVEFKQRGGQRIRTVLIYLNDEFEGGETEFPNLRLMLQPPPRGAVIFYPGTCDPAYLHGGLPVTSGVKIICNVWFRESTFI